MYILYGAPITRSLLVEMVMAEGGIAFERRAVDIFRDQHRTPEFLALNPAGRVPVLVTPESEALTETPAIALYLCERHRLRDLAPAPGEPERGAFLAGLFFLAGEVEPAIKRYFYPERDALRPGDVAAAKAHALGVVLERFAVIERRLAERGPSTSASASACST